MMGPDRPTTGRLVRLGLLGFIATVGFDLFLHAGVLAPLYTRPTPFLLPPRRAFVLIPVGYASFAVMIAYLVWLWVRLGVRGWTAGLRFGLAFGGVVWGALALGLASVTTAPPSLLLGWFLGQTAELGVVGAIVGSGLERESLKGLAWRTVLFAAAAAVLGIVIQNILGVDFGVATG